MKPLCEQFPYWEFVSTPIPHMVLWDGSLSAGIEITPIDIECYDATRINQLTERLRIFLNSLPEGITAQFLYKFTSDFGGVLNSHRDLLSTKSEFLRELDRARCEGLEAAVTSGSLFRPKLVLFLKTSPPIKPGAFSLKGMEKFSKDFENGYRDGVGGLSQAINNVRAALLSAGIESKSLGQADLIDGVYRHLNPRRAELVPAPDFTKNVCESPRSRLALSDLLLDQNDFVLDQERVRVLSLKSLPEVTFAGMMSAFLSLPFKFEMIFSIHVPDQTKEMRALEQKRRMAFSLTANPGARVSDLEGESRLEQTTGLIREIIESGQKIFESEMIILIRGENSSEGIRTLESQTREVLSKFKTLSGAEGLQETLAAWPIFSASLPGAPIDLVRRKRLKTNNLADFLPVFGAAASSGRPMVLTQTRQKSLCSLDPYDPGLTNYNMLVTGSSGSGKSFANNFFLLQQVARGTRVFIIDIGGSYKKMTELFGGQYFEIGLNNGHAFNPFNVGILSAERIKSLVAIVEQMVVDEGERLSRLERVELERAITDVYSLQERPRLSDLLDLCAKSIEAPLVRISKLLGPWVGDSPYGRLLDRDGGIATDSPIVAFDLKGLSQYPDLQSVMILILTNFILGQVESRGAPKRVLLDEAWGLLKSQAASSFMEYAARTFRKTGSGITFITQGVEEIVQSPIGSAILNNTASKLVMLQKGDVRVLKDALQLNAEELRLIQSLEQKKGVFSEGLFIAGESRRVLRITPSPLEYWISTSDAADDLLLENLISECGSLQAAIREAAKRAPGGVAQMKKGAA